MGHKSIWASEVAAGMSLRLQRLLHLKMQDNEHENATGSHSPTTESVSIPFDALNFHSRLLEPLS